MARRGHGDMYGRYLAGACVVGRLQRNIEDLGCERELVHQRPPSANTVPSGARTLTTNGISPGKL